MWLTPVRGWKQGTGGKSISCQPVWSGSQTLKHRTLKEIYNYISLLAFPQPLVLIIHGFKMVKERESHKWKTKSNRDKPLKNKLKSKWLLLPSKSGKCTPCCHQRGFQTRHSQMGTKLFEWKIQPSSFLCLPQSAARTGTETETSLASERLKRNFLGNTESHSQSQGNCEAFFPPSLLCSLLSPIYFFFSCCSFSDHSITVTLSPSPPRCEPAHPLEAESHCGGGK